MDPGLFFYIYYFLLQALFTFRNYYLLTANKYHFLHDTFNPLLSANRWDWQPQCKLRQSILVVLCVGSTLLLVPKICSRHAPSTNTLVSLPKSASNNLQEWFLSPTGWLNLGIITEGIFTAILIIPSSWGFPTGPVRYQTPLPYHHSPPPHSHALIFI
jgi:hypothetical protein